MTAIVTAMKASAAMLARTLIIVTARARRTAIMAKAVLARSIHQKT